MPSEKPSNDDMQMPMTPHQPSADEETDAAAIQGTCRGSQKDFRQKINIDELPPKCHEKIEGMIEKLESMKVIIEHREQWNEGYSKRVDEYCHRVDRLTVGPDSYKANLDDCLQEADECIKAMRVQKFSLP